MTGYFTIRNIDKLAQDKDKQLEILDRSKRFLGKLYGMGRSSKSKPSVLIDMAKDLYEGIAEKMEQMQEE